MKLASFPGSYPAGWDLGIMRLYQTPCLVATELKHVSKVGIGLLLGQRCICTYIFVYNILTKRIRALKKALQDRSLVEQHKNEAST